MVCIMTPYYIYALINKQGYPMILSGILLNELCNLMSLPGAELVSKGESLNIKSLILDFY